MRIAGYRRRPARDDILIALMCLPLYVAAVGRYGQRIALALVVSAAVGALTEIVAARIRGKELLLLGFPCWVLMPLVLPPVFPLWMLGAAVFFGTVIGVVFFGGYGRQLASPVAIGWAFAALSYPSAFGFGWSLPFPDLAMGYTRFMAAVPTIDDPAIFLQAQRSVLLSDLLLGNAPNTPGMAVPLLVLACGLVLYLLRAVDVRSSVVFMMTAGVLGFVFHRVLPGQFADPRFLLTGNLILAGLFIFPDRRISPRTWGGRLVTALVAGVIAFLVRNLSNFPCGVMFAVLFANVFSPIIDEGFLKVAYGMRRGEGGGDEGAKGDARGAGGAKAAADPAAGGACAECGGAGGAPRGEIRGGGR